MLPTPKNTFARLIALLFLVPNWILFGSPLKQDEEIIFFPTSANQSGDKQWQIPLHAWVFEPEPGSLTQKWGSTFIGELLELADISEEQAHSALFKERIKWFLVDNERNKRITVRLNQNTYTSPRSKANGHTRFTIKATLSTPDSSWIKLPAVLPQGDIRQFQANIQLIPETGLSVISDIDDTIKVSNVPDKKSLIEHIFFKDYETTPGMPAFYAHLQQQGAYFHYISASPWQLYPSLQPFMQTHYPRGSYSLRNFRTMDSSFIRFFLSSMDYKISAISTLIKRYPRHRFILIGDSGEKDPEVYAAIYAKFPDNIEKILIRNIPGSNTGKQRKQKVFQHIPGNKWHFFDEPKPGCYPLYD